MKRITKINSGIDHACCIATVRTSKSRAIKAHYLNLAAYWRMAYIQSGDYARKMKLHPLAIASATSDFTQGVTGQLPA